MKKDITTEIGWVVILDGQIYEFEFWCDAIKVEGELTMTRSYYIHHWLPEHETK